MHIRNCICIKIDRKDSCQTFVIEMWHRVAEASFVTVAIVEGSQAEVVAGTCWAATDVVAREVPCSCSFARSPSSSERKDLGRLVLPEQAAMGVEAGNYFATTTAEVRAESRHSYSVVAGSIVGMEAAVKISIAEVDVDTAVMADVVEEVIAVVAIGDIVGSVVAVG